MARKHRWLYDKPPCEKCVRVLCEMEDNTREYVCEVYTRKLPSANSVIQIWQHTYFVCGAYRTYQTNSVDPVYHLVVRHMTGILIKGTPFPVVGVR